MHGAIDNAPMPCDEISLVPQVSNAVVIFAFCMWRPWDGWCQWAYLGLFPDPIAKGSVPQRYFFTNGTAEHGHCPVFDSLGNAVVTFAMQVEEKVRSGSEVRFRQIGELV
jgi:hypothetical protein